MLLQLEFYIVELLFNNTYTDKNLMEESNKDKMGRFSIYSDLISTETKIVRRNLLATSIPCLFVATSEKIPTSLPLIDINDSSHPYLIGWFLLYGTIYLLLHFLSLALINIADWVHPLLMSNQVKETMLGHPAIDETFYLDIEDIHDNYDLEVFGNRVKKESIEKVNYKLRFLYMSVYLKITLEVLVPIILATTSILLLLNLLLST